MRASSRLLCTPSFGTFYQNQLVSGKLRPDPRQLEAVKVLDSLERSFLNTLSSHSQADSQRSPKNLLNLFSWLKQKPAGAVPNHGPTGIYLYGGVGCGKTMIMELFFDRFCWPRKRREHFHEFMNDFHRRAFRLRASGDRTGDAVATIADQISAEAPVLFVDEFQVTDIADALILTRLFSRLFENGLVFLTTSNRSPEELYKNGLQRSLFLPFLPLLHQNCLVYNMESGTDYRLLGTPASELFNVPGPGETMETVNTSLDKLFARMTDGETVESRSVNVSGRLLIVERSTEKGFAYFDFSELCDQPLSSADYIALCHNFHTIFIRNIPILALISNRNVARRFITLIDQVYEHRVKLCCSAQARPNELVDRESVTVDSPDASDEIFAADRTISRLLEIQSEGYVKLPWRPSG